MGTYLLVLKGFVFGLLLIFCPAMAGAQQGNIAQPGSSPSNIEQRVQLLEQEINKLTRSNQDKDKTVSELTKKVDFFDTKYHDYIIFIDKWGSVLGIIGAFLAFVFSWYQIRRIKLHEKISKQGQETVSLVNDILKLAGEATSSAMNAATARTERDRAALDEHVKNIMKFANKDDRNVVTHHDAHDKLRDLFNECTIFDFNNKNLDKPLDFTPAITFLQGLKYSQEHNFDKAIERWGSILNDPQAGDGVKIRSRYWMGHQQNQLGRFTHAEESFSAAVSLAHRELDERRLELMRLNIEAKLFKLHAGGAGKLLEEIDELIAECVKKNLLEVEMSARRTKGDILHSMAMDAHSDGDTQSAINAMREAKGLWKQLVGLELPDPQHAFAKREYVFACIALHEELDTGFRQLLQDVRDEARNSYTNCIGNRSKAYYAMIQLMVAKAQNAKERAEDMDTRANFHVGAMHEAEWPTSALKKRPVPRHEFQRDIRIVSENGLPVLVP